MEAMGLVFHVLLGVDKHVGILIGCGIVLLYTTFGGMQSVIVADILQFVLLATGMPLLLFMALQKADGPTAVFCTVRGSADEAEGVAAACSSCYFEPVEPEHITWQAAFCRRPCAGAVVSLLTAP